MNPEQPSGSVSVPTTYSLAVVDALAHSPGIPLEADERPKYRMDGDRALLAPGVRVVCPGQVPVFVDYRDRLILLREDRDHARLAAKADSDRFDPRYESAPRMGSANSEDAVMWSVLRTFERRGPVGWLRGLMGRGLERAGNGARAAELSTAEPVFRFWEPLPPPPAYPNREGRSEIDALATIGETDLISIEAKVGAFLSLRTTWGEARNQLIRNADVVSWLARKTGIARCWITVMIPAAADDVRQFVRSYVEDPKKLAAALPHRPAAEIQELAGRIAILTWEDALRAAAPEAEVPVLPELPGWAPEVGGDSRIARPLVALAASASVNEPGTCLAFSRDLSAEDLLRRFAREMEEAPQRAGRGKRYFMGHDGIPGSGSSTNRLEEHLAIALFNAFRPGQSPLRLPDGDSLTLLDYQFPLKARQGDAGVGKVDLLGLDSRRRLVLIELKVAGRRPDTPLRAALEGLAYVAIVRRNQAVIRGEAGRVFGLDVAPEMPRVLVAAPEDYWAFHRGRVSDGAFNEAMAELARKVLAATGVELGFLSLGPCGVSPGLNREPPRLTGGISPRPA